MSKRIKYTLEFLEAVFTNKHVKRFMWNFFSVFAIQGLVTITAPDFREEVILKGWMFAFILPVILVPFFSAIVNNTTKIINNGIRNNKLQK